MKPDSSRRPGRDVRSGFVEPATASAFTSPTDLDKVFGPEKFQPSPEAAAARARMDTLRAARHVAELAELEAQKPAAWRQALNAAAPIPNAEQVFGPLRETEALQVVRDWLKTDCTRGICIRGPVGCGKSLAAAFAVKHWVEPTVVTGSESWPDLQRGAPVSWLRPDELSSAVLHAYDKDAPKLHKYVVLDDLGRESKSSFPEALCQLLEGTRDGKRYVNHIVCVTTNLTKAQLRDRYEPRVLSRLGHHLDAFDVRGDDLRRDGGF